MLNKITAILTHYAISCHPDPQAPDTAWRAWLAAFVEPSDPEREYCPRCAHGELVQRQGNRGRFLGCATYPTCKFTKSAPPNMPEKQKTDLCPLCRVGRIVSKISKRGNEYFQCDECRLFAGSRFLTDEEKLRAAADRARKAAAKRAAKAAKKGPQRELVLQLPVAGFDYSEWGEAWGNG